MNRKRGFWIALWVILVVVTGFLAFGHGSGVVGYGPWHGWGRMGGWHDGGRYRADDVPGWYGRGPGMMGGAASGQGWSRGRPYGMMGPNGAGMAGWGYAMMPWWLPDLTPEQVQKIGQLHNELAQRNLGVMQQRWETQARLQSLYAAEKRDWNAIRATSRSLFDLQRQQMDAAIDVQQKIDGVLTASQRQQMAQAWRDDGWMGAQ
jgi:Spy/CpxP family protein refolding chaperone